MFKKTYLLNLTIQTYITIEPPPPPLNGGHKKHPQLPLGLFLPPSSPQEIGPLPRSSLRTLLRGERGGGSPQEFPSDHGGVEVEVIDIASSIDGFHFITQ